MRMTRLLALTALAGAALPSMVAAQSISYTGSYTQDFNALASTGSSNVLPSGFRLNESGTGAGADGNYVAGNGSGATGSAYSFGTTAADRALGSLTSGTTSPIYYGAVFTNALTTTITQLTTAFTGEQWRQTNATTDSLFFDYAVGAAAGLPTATAGWTTVSGLTFTPLKTASNGTSIALDGNAAGNNIRLSSVISGLSIAAGSQFAIRWRDEQVSGSGGNQGFGVDDLSITSPTPVAAVPEPATWAMMMTGFALVGATLRRRRRAPASVLA